MAQSTRPVGVTNNGGVFEMQTIAPEAIVVNLEVESESIIVGKYARYAQEYLGVRVPLVAKTTSRIIAADVALAPENYYIADDEMLNYNGAEMISDVADDLPLNITSSATLSMEDAAEECAEAIFTIRALRRDILSGELGEGFYGGGLAAALERMEREERSYTELFLGRTITTRSRSTHFVALEGDKKRYIICRFSATEGVVSVEDMKADPIVLQLTPSAQSEPETPYIDAKSRAVKFRVSKIVRCDLYNNTTAIASKSVPLNIFGYDYTHVYPLTK